MINLHYAKVDNEDDIPCYETQSKDSLLSKVHELIIENKKVVMLICFNDQVFVSDNPAYIYCLIDQMFEPDGKITDNIFLQEYRSYEMAYEVALMMAEQNELCYEPE